MLTIQELVQPLPRGTGPRRALTCRVRRKAMGSVYELRMPRGSGLWLLPVIAARCLCQGPDTLGRRLIGTKAACSPRFARLIAGPADVRLSGCGAQRAAAIPLEHRKPCRWSIQR